MDCTKSCVAYNWYVVYVQYTVVTPTDRKSIHYYLNLIAIRGARSLAREL